MTGINLDAQTYENITTWMYALDTTRIKLANTIVRFVKDNPQKFSEFQDQVSSAQDTQLPMSPQEGGRMYIALDERTHKTIAKMSREMRTSRKKAFKQMVDFVATVCEEFRKAHWNEDKKI